MQKKKDTKILVNAYLETLEVFLHEKEANKAKLEILK